MGSAISATSDQPVFQAAYEVDLFGRISSQVDAAVAGTVAGEAARDAAALAVAAATASGYIASRWLDQRLAILEQTVVSRREAMEIARERADVGYTSDLERRQAEGEYEGTAQQLPQVRVALERQEHALALLTGMAPGAIPRGLPVARVATPPILAGLPSDLLRRRPDIAEAEYTLVAADASLAAARTQFLASLRLTGRAGGLLVSSIPDPLAVWSVGASVLAPIFNAGRIQAQVDTAEARREQSAFADRRTVLIAFREVEDNLSAVIRTREQRSHLEAQRAAVADPRRPPLPCGLLIVPRAAGRPAQRAHGRLGSGPGASRRAGCTHRV